MRAASCLSVLVGEGAQCVAVEKGAVCVCGWPFVVGFRVLGEGGASLQLVVQF